MNIDWRAIATKFLGDWRFIALLIFITVATALAVAGIWLSFDRQQQCELRGGVYRLSLCLSPEALK